MGGGIRSQVGEFEHERMLEHVAGSRDLLTLAGEQENLVGGLVQGQAFEEQRRDLALKLADRPTLPGRLDLVEGAGSRILNPEQDQVVGPSQCWRKERCRTSGRKARRR